ncbi:MAG: adaptor protein MecA [Clostridia bacterium]|nr:adaptor protein MecA [Clostridia bacterium]
MQIEKLNENKIRIILNLEDLKEKNIDLHSFMSSSIESQDLFYDMLDAAEREIGFKTKDYKLMIEALAIPEGKFVLTITRFLPEKEQIKKLKVKRKNVNLGNNLSIYMFNGFDDYLEFCNYIQKYLNNDTYAKLNKTSLYQYNSKYYLCVNMDNISLDIFKCIHCSIVEFATHITNSDLFERKLIEYGKVIFKTNAISECIKAFL